MTSNSLSDSFLKLVQIMDDLREKCPWDKKQTIDTLRHMTIEELYELVDAVTDHDWQGIKEELGDLMLHVVFYAKIASEEQQFTLKEALDGICEKLIIRHPHVYGEVTVNDEEDVKRNWEKIKLKEEGKKSVLSGVPASLPAMVKAMRIQTKVRQVGFDWNNKEDVWKKVEEEIQELHSEVAANNTAAIEEEFGDLMFSMINYARFLGIDPENALEKTNKKFQKRFMSMEEIAAASGKKLSDMTLEEMDSIWNEVKK